MKPQLRVVSGGRAGHTEVFSKHTIKIGRHPACDLALDPELDLKASARHATIVQRNGEWFVRDEQSRNGTYVNGHRVSTDTRLDDTDQVSVGGKGGPVIEVRMVPDGTPDGTVASANRPAPSAPPPAGPGAHPEALRRPTAAAARPGGSTTERVRVAVGKQTRTLRRTVIGLVVTLVAVAGVAFAITRQQAAARAREMAEIQARTDSILRDAEAAMRALQGQVEGLGSRLRQSQSEIVSLQGRLAAAQDADEIEALKDQLAAATTALSYQQTAAEVDYRNIVEANRYAVALVWVKFGPEETFTGTAFAVREDGTLITNRHVVYGEEGNRRPVEIAVKFEESRQVWPAEILGVSPNVDLAAIKVNIRGGTPAVRGLNPRFDAISQGDPVAVIGFPLGTDLLMSGAGTQVAKSSFNAGSVSRVLPDLIQIDGYGTQGASGSPIFDRHGDVIGVLYGGQAGTGGRIIFAVPASHVISLLDSLN